MIITKRTISIISLVLSSILVFLLCSCGNSASHNSKTVSLTPENINDYISIQGRYLNGDYHSALIYYISTADLELQAYNTAAGTFDNVEITVVANLSDRGGALNEKWHLDGEESTQVLISFKMPSSGQYSSTYSIECLRCTDILSGPADISIKSVSGTFTPSN